MGTFRAALTNVMPFPFRCNAVSFRRRVSDCIRSGMQVFPRLNSAPARTVTANPSNTNSHSSRVYFVFEFPSRRRLHCSSSLLFFPYPLLLLRTVVPRGIILRNQSSFIRLGSTASFARKKARRRHAHSTLGVRFFSVSLNVLTCCAIPSHCWRPAREKNNGRALSKQTGTRRLGKPG